MQEPTANEKPWGVLAVLAVALGYALGAAWGCRVLDELHGMRRAAEHLLCPPQGVRK